MPKKYTDEEYAQILPRKIVGTAVIFFNSKNELLIVKPNYREEWLVPGGSADANESPLACALRETQEEIGLTISTLELIGIQYGSQKNVFSDSLKFIYHGGILTDSQISDIHLQKKELDEYLFVPVERALELVSVSLRKSIPACLQAIREDKVAYIQ